MVRLGFVLAAALLTLPTVGSAQEFQEAKAVPTGTGIYGGRTLVTFVIVTKEGEIEYCVAQVALDPSVKCKTLSN